MQIRSAGRDRSGESQSRNQLTSPKAKGYWSRIERGKRGLKSTCCPEKTHYAKGLCKKCYYKDKWENDPVWRAQQQSLSRVREAKRPARIKNSDDQRDKRDAVLYNLLPGDRERIWEYQDGMDPISGMPLVPAANLDHDHRTGLVRGLLNPITNKFLCDDREKLLAMLAYIEDPPAPIALGEKVYGLMGQAKITKKNKRYGPEGLVTRQVRKAKDETQA